MYPCSLWPSFLFSLISTSRSAPVLFGHLDHDHFTPDLFDHLFCFLGMFSLLSLSLFFVVLLLSLIIFFDQGAFWHQACVFFMLPIKAYTPLPSFLVWIFFHFVFFLFYGWLQFHELRSLTVSPVYQICHLSVSVASQWCAFYGTCPKSPQIGRDK